jgi:hypothetical protein
MVINPMKTVLYDSTDTEDLHRVNGMRFPDNWRWHNCPMDYTFNSHGWRMNQEISDIAPDNYLLFVGCSHTVGVGLPIEETFPWIISQKFNMDYINTAVSGISPQFAADTMLTVLNSHPKPAAIIINWPSLYAKVYYDSVRPVHCLPGRSFAVAEPYKESYLKYLNNEGHIITEFNVLRTRVTTIARLLAIRLVEFTQCATPLNKQLDVPILNTARLKESDSITVLNEDFARDVQRPSTGWLGHYGISQQQLIVDYCAAKLATAGL